MEGSCAAALGLADVDEGAHFGAAVGPLTGLAEDALVGAVDARLSGVVAEGAVRAALRARGRLVSAGPARRAGRRARRAQGLHARELAREAVAALGRVHLRGFGRELARGTEPADRLAGLGLVVPGRTVRARCRRRRAHSTGQARVADVAVGNTDFALRAVRARRFCTPRLGLEFSGQAARAGGGLTRGLELAGGAIGAIRRGHRRVLPREAGHALRGVFGGKRRRSGRKLGAGRARCAARAPHGRLEGARAAAGAVVWGARGGGVTAPGAVRAARRQVRRGRGGEAARGAAHAGRRGVGPRVPARRAEGARGRAACPGRARVPARDAAVAADRPRARLVQAHPARAAAGLAAERLELAHEARRARGLPWCRGPAHGTTEAHFAGLRRVHARAARDAITRRAGASVGGVGAHGAVRAHGRGRGARDGGERAISALAAEVCAGIGLEIAGPARRARGRARVLSEETSEAGRAARRTRNQRDQAH